MTMTPTSGAQAYATPADVTTRADWRTLARLVVDGDVPLASKAAVEADAVLATVLKECSGMVEAACLKASRYDSASLAALAGTNAGEMLAGLVADLVIWRLYLRRPNVLAAMPERCKAALETLKQLREGEEIFPFREVQDAGHLSHTTLTAQDVAARADVVELQRRYRGRRAASEGGGRFAG
jgi:hypothetical protein